MQDFVTENTGSGLRVARFAVRQTWARLRRSASEPLDRFRHRAPYLAVIMFGLGVILAAAGASPLVAAILLGVPPFAALALPRTGFTGPLPESQLTSEAPASLAVWRNLIGALPEAAILASRQGTILAHNRKAEELFAQVREGVQLAGILRNPEFLAMVREAELSREPRAVRFAIRVPVERQLQATCAPLPDGVYGGDGMAVLINFVDFTESDRVERMRTDFIANASHELRTPLASVLGFIETLQGPARNDSAARQRFLGIMAVEAARMKRLIDDLTSLSRVEMREHLRPSDRVDLNRIAAQCCEALEPLAQEAGVRMTLVLLAGAATVLGDRDELAQVCQNLVQNALKYGAEGGLAEIALGRQPNGRIVLSVRDHGQGIAPRHLPRLTERFYRVDVARSRDKGGTGLGLAIVKHIVARHGGELKIESELGKGSLFAVLLPGAQPER